MSSIWWGRAGTYRSSSVLNQVPVVSRWKMDQTCDNVKLNPSAGTWDTVTRALGIWDWLNISFIILIQSRWLPKPFAAAKIHHEGSIQTFRASVKAPLGEDGWRRYLPPIVTRLGKEVDALDGGEDFEGGLGVGGEPLLV